MALALALGKLYKEGKLPAKSLKEVLIDSVSAISIGMNKGEILTDLDYNEDSSCDVDMNFVIMGQGGFVEVQGTAEKKSFTKTDLDKMTEAAVKATTDLRAIQVSVLEKAGVTW